MTCEVIDRTQCCDVSCSHQPPQEDVMTALTTTRAQSTEDRLRTVLRADAGVTGIVGLFALVGPTSTYGDVPGWLPRTIGVVLLALAVEFVLAARLSGSRLRLAGLVTGELALGWVVTTIAILAVVDLPGSGREVLALVGLATLGFAIAELRLVRSLSAAV